MAFHESSLFQEWHERLLARRLDVHDLGAAVSQPCEEGVLHLCLAELIECEEDSSLPLVLLFVDILHQQLDLLFKASSLPDPHRSKHILVGERVSIEDV